jgi:hypothetical protein
LTYNATIPCAHAALATVERRLPASDARFTRSPDKLLASPDVIHFLFAPGTPAELTLGLDTAGVVVGMTELLQFVIALVALVARELR